jgi:hypothetical protein
MTTKCTHPMAVARFRRQVMPVGETNLVHASTATILCPVILHRKVNQNTVDSCTASPGARDVGRLEGVRNHLLLVHVTRWSWQELSGVGRRNGAAVLLGPLTNPATPGSARNSPHGRPHGRCQVALRLNWCAGVPSLHCTAVTVRKSQCLFGYNVGTYILAAASLTETISTSVIGQWAPGSVCGGHTVRGGVCVAAMPAMAKWL